ncbi:hypothetical protein [Streptomyces coeruleorubidus]|uniref:hypothetical protein n=1 Tax=Streptomyces coeruleorubidus TaxID=116188 RepID=UPI0033E0291B
MSSRHRPEAQVWAGPTWSCRSTTGPTVAEDRGVFEQSEGDGIEEQPGAGRLQRGAHRRACPQRQHVVVVRRRSAESEVETERFPDVCVDVLGDAGAQGPLGGAVEQGSVGPYRLVRLSSLG